MKKSSSLFRFLSILVIAVLLSSCNQLTRTQAQNLINQNAQFNTEIQSINYGRIRTGNPNELDGLKSLGRAGVITYSDLGFDGSYNSYYLQFTPLAQQYIVTLYPDWDPPTAKVKFARKEVVEITGIQLYPGGTQAQVTFLWKYTDITPFAVYENHIAVECPYCDLTKLYPGNMLMTKYDDGWRVGN